jgi:hypothetical protein
LRLAQESQAGQAARLGDPPENGALFSRNLPIWLSFAQAIRKGGRSANINYLLSKT